ncbi:1,4-alpha-glucan branching protein domain-containing protein [Protofrankia symbiont of Coriaria ruscifolia]|uniref:1,4-alpha-glucan branching protein domain-containing protein n=1 Tax=Protofrankia symbiont of Coriaria ruscifolia TaxID=1306542 RepID=UPI0010417D1B
MNQPARTQTPVPAPAQTPAAAPAQTPAQTPALSSAGTAGRASAEPIGTFCLVLHTHLPWVAHAGAWPVGEEWLYQAWTGAYLPVVDLLERLADTGRRNVLTLGVTPVLAAMVDDPYCLSGLAGWVADWQLRTQGALVDGVPGASYEGALATRALRAVEGRWRHGASPLLRRLADAGVIELLGGPASHPVLPLLDDRVVRTQLDAGLDDATVRFGARLRGIWAPECAYRPGLEQHYADAGITHFVVDGPTVGGETAGAYDVAGSGVLAFPRDLGVSYEVWSPTAGYPAGAWYRDFHTFDHGSGLRVARVTSVDTPPELKAPYEAVAAQEAAGADAAHFVGVVRRRLTELAEARDGRPALVVCAFDTELFGHHWHEGPAFLEAVLGLLPDAGVRVTTLSQAAAAGHVEGVRDLPAGSWGLGKDFHVWTDVTDLTKLASEVNERLVEVVAAAARPSERDDVLDQMAREAFLTGSSDWAFCVTHDSAASYARSRAYTHAGRFDALADAVHGGDRLGAAKLARHYRTLDYPFPALDARRITRAQEAP